MQKALFFYHSNKEGTPTDYFPSEPLKVVFLTSLRDILKEEQNGQTIMINGVPTYIEGVIERTVRETLSGGALNGIIEVRGVIVDDMPKDLGDSYSVLPTESKPWIFPQDLTGNDGVPLKDKVFNIPSLFRKMSRKETSLRKNLKYAFEYEVLEKVKEMGGDVLILDSYMAIVEFLVKKFGMKDKVLNIHPGPTLLDRPYCFRGADPVGDAIRFAQEKGSPVYTGATLHFVNGRIDDGRPIAYVCNTPVHEIEDEIEVMHRNYMNAKIPIFVDGLKHYALQIYPYLQK